ncbi:Glutamate 5-kinase / RNA-binding C-terminal domain PUA [Altererythrobacter epoxidivorans]|uniref:Glutamate 5-kinase n=1 Tax=Altererythrobacter epoxidivorans TaxID=361183 RepID=A0A0M4MUS0_9SPHN|nr:glutamate 5-kinase [Altererythrobacter epoxidivorans]ALE17308.1 Glutamate 5-kinase / RNA-binding C-terminal domain PUA [Altererythrobacter epoxidivorans]
MSKKKRIVVKVGSTLLANTDRLTPRFAFMQRLLEDIARLRDDGYDVILASSGAVALGLNTVGAKPETAGLSDKQAAAACGMPLLLNAYRQVGHEFGFEIAQILLTLGDFENHRRFLNTRNTVNRLLKARIVPIVNENDTITTEEIRVGDNDRLAAKIAQMVEADAFIILTGVDGLYDRDPSEEGAQLVEELHDVSEYLAAASGTSSLGTGGMLTKLQAANMAQNAGCTTYIANGEADYPLTSVLRGERRCTVCVAHSEPNSLWETWLADRLQMAGSLVVNDDAASRLGKDDPIHRRDVIKMDGDYTRGDVLHIYDEQGNELARGLSDFTSEETAVMINNQDLPADQLLGYQTHAELIRPENLVVLENRHLTWDTPEGVS